jgi:hypothetical protein
MGAGNIVESNIKSATESVWSSLPKVADKSWLDFDLKGLNKHFVNLAVAVGVIVLAKSTLKFAGKALKSATKCRKVPSSLELRDKYGHNSWAVIGDCKGN